ncbi:methionine ABC transporter ATP-binding protein [Caldifermentibacillus hisashii]|uniref:methionine ABC transporter ATP-binding protein n=1 Tax=Caldifermentibacillus hisashii TaxID=996558 RepID=UPI000BA34A44|nr:methionine ABC transporter ATP-binding protein [Caldifermentibacillus hisashii]MEC5273498.1 methionine ABC transporter ATP-binding protein [Caldifermentibacillus hisashii]MED4853188.1 methionine ABC transporter ATP-binding protein [Caldifermentibacillus hisashii]PAC35743.1 methionine ABC transporter ATP-binding protein [Caldifermentibacillus hisashii]
MIDIKNLTKTYFSKDREVKAVDNVSITIHDEEIFGIVGYSGAGKSSLLRCINLLERPTSGKITVDGVDLTKLDSKRLRQARLKIGMIFQHFNLVSQKTVAENIAFALKASKTPKNKIEKRVDELLDMVGLADKKDVYPGQLSGGQKQRVGIARALANNPKVLLCDEATSALDPTTTKSILNLLKKINKELNITIIIITHEMDVVKEICHRMAIMENGRIVEQGNVYDIFASPKEQLTKEFIQSVVSFDLPKATLRLVKGTLVKLLFRGEVAGEGVVSETLKKFQINGNFLHGSIEYIQERPLGIFIMELTGDQEEINKAIHYIEHRNAEVEVLNNGI